jgi:hypothetical protein
METFYYKASHRQKQPEMFTANKIYGKYAKIRAERQFRRTRHQFGVA